MSNLISVQDLERSKVYVSDKSAVVRFKHPMDYLGRVFEILQPFNPDISISGIANAKNRDRDQVIDGTEILGEENVSYSRVLVRAKMPSDLTLTLPFNTDFNELTAEVGFSFGLDMQSPQIKAYSGRRVTICSNGCIFGTDSITTLDLLRTSDDQAIYNTFESYAENIAKKHQVYLDRAEQLYNNRVSGKDLYARVGELSWQAKQNPKIGISMATEVIGLLQDKKTRYAVGEDGSITDWHLYNACTEVLKKSNILDEATKIQLLDKVFRFKN